MSKHKRTLKKPSEEGRIPTYQIEKAVKAVHVAPSNGEWIVTKGGRGHHKINKRFSSKREAVDYGKQVSRSKHSGMYIHHKNGKVREIDQYSGGPHPARG